MFIVYISDLLDTRISIVVSKSTNDTKVGRVSESDQAAAVLLGELDRLYDLEKKWGMEFNVGKRSLMSVGRNNHLHNCCLNDTSVSRSRRERDLGVLVRPDLRQRPQCVHTRNRTNKTSAVHF